MSEYIDILVREEILADDIINMSSSDLEYNLSQIKLPTGIIYKIM